MVKNDFLGDCEWIVKYFIFIIFVEVLWIVFLIYVLYFYMYILCNCVNNYCKFWFKCYVYIKYKVYVVFGDDVRYEELEVILKFNKIFVKIINVGECILLDLF